MGIGALPTNENILERENSLVVKYIFNPRNSCSIPHFPKSKFSQSSLLSPIQPTSFDLLQSFHIFSLSILPPPPPPRPPPPPMGCGMSRYGMADHLDFHPIRRKLDNLCRSDRLVVTIDDTPSTKLLLRDGEDHAASNCDNSRKSISSPHEEALKGPSLEHKESLKIAEGDNTKKKNGGEEKENEVKAKNEEVVAAERDDNKDNDGEEEESDYDDEEGRLSNYDGSALWIDSPSFREYCTHDCDSDDSSKDDGE